MMNKFKLVIFDLDGTLLDTSEGILSAAKYAITTCGKNLPSQAVLDSYIGPPIQQSFAKTFGISGEELANMALCFRNRYKDYDLLKAKPYENIFTLCQKLLDVGFSLAVATYKREDYANILLKHFGFDKYMKVICGSDFAGQLTKADIIKKAIASAGIEDYKDVLMIGDTEHDAIGASALGLAFVGVTYGFGFKNRNELNGENIVGIADDTKQIGEILLGERQ